MKIEVGIGRDVFAICNTEGEKRFSCYIFKSQDKEVFEWVSKFLIKNNCDITRKHKWYIVEL